MQQHVGINRLLGKPTKIATSKNMFCRQTYNPQGLSLLVSHHPVKAPSSLCRRRFLVPPRSCTKAGTLLSPDSTWLPFMRTVGSTSKYLQIYLPNGGIYSKGTVRNSPLISQKSHGPWVIHFAFSRVLWKIVINRLKEIDTLLSCCFSLNATPHNMCIYIYICMYIYIYIYVHKYTYLYVIWQLYGSFGTSWVYTIYTVDLWNLGVWDIGYHENWSTWAQTKSGRIASALDDFSAKYEGEQLL